ncbi:SRPBCC family protein [Kribbella sp. NBC_01484]|uniref:SRPBCC family protein n=1 Tax=Kribbella sp. NBC_01484 TaxID=2903579 RepID=UPI002E2F45F4|nr:SRPBCC family protein [Kribbella sp. NBC_01484]
MVTLLIDQVLPSYDYAIVHASVFHTPPEACFRAACELDVLRNPLVRTLIRARSLATPSQRPRRLRVLDMAGPPLNWLTLAEGAGSEIVLGQLSRPWAADAASPTQPRTAEEFAAFDRPGFAKIALSLRADPYGAASAILTVETRVALTDADSRRRFRRYWRMVRPASELIRRLAFRQIAADLAAPRADVRGEIDILRPTDIVFDTVADERNEPHFNPRLHRVEKATPGPVGVGTTFRAETTTMGRSVPMTIEYTDFQRPHRLGSVTHMQAMDIEGALTFDPTSEGTRMSWAWNLHPHGAAALIHPLVVAVGRRQERAIWGELKRYLEDNQQASGQKGDA